MFSADHFMKTFADAYGKNTYRKYCGLFPLEAFFTPEMVYETAMRCASGFRNRNDTQRFLTDAHGNSQKLCDSVLDGSFVPQYYRKKKINERGKEREIRPPTFECKIVQKLLCDWLIRPIIESRCRPACYAALKGKGTALMHEQIEEAVNEALDDFGTGKYGGRLVLADYKGYFASVDLNILFSILDRYIEDRRITDLMRQFYEGDKGLSLGDELSQLPASWFPTIVDNYIADRYHGRKRFRYMDDAMFIASGINEAEKYLDDVKRKSDEIGLTLKDEKTKIIPLGRSFVFCHERYIYSRKDHKYHREINPSVIKAEKRKLKYAEKELAEIRRKGAPKELKEAEKKWENQIRGWAGTIASHPNTRLMLKEMEKRAARSGFVLKKKNTPALY